MSKSNLKFGLIAVLLGGGAFLYLKARNSKPAETPYSPYSGAFMSTSRPLDPTPNTVPAEQYNPFTGYLRFPPNGAITSSAPNSVPAQDYNPFSSYLRFPRKEPTPAQYSYPRGQHGPAAPPLSQSPVMQAQYSARGIRNNNPGNLRKGPAWQGLTGTQSDPAFSTFTSPEYGIRAMARTLSTYRSQGYTTIAQIIGRWAPSSENNTTAYINAVAAYVGIGANQEVNYQTNLVRLIQGIILHENGAQPYTYAQIKLGIDMAGNYA